MRIEKECPCCGAVYMVRFENNEVVPVGDREWDPDEETFDDEDQELYPEFCPFCGSHEDDEPLDEDQE
jgi:ribosomal protein S27AE